MNGKYLHWIYAKVNEHITARYGGNQRYSPILDGLEDGCLDVGQGFVMILEIKVSCYLDSDSALATGYRHHVDVV